jgi:hypothetical protein
VFLLTTGRAKHCKTDCSFFVPFHIHSYRPYASWDQSSYVVFDRTACPMFLQFDHHHHKNPIHRTGRTATSPHWYTRVHVCTSSFDKPSVYRRCRSYSRLEHLSTGASVTFTTVAYAPCLTGTPVTLTPAGERVRLGTITRKLATESAFTILEAVARVICSACPISPVVSIGDSPSLHSNDYLFVGACVHSRIGLTQFQPS